MPGERQVVHVSRRELAACSGVQETCTRSSLQEKQTGGAYFVMEALVPPGDGPPPHVHRNEDEIFYIV